MRHYRLIWTGAWSDSTRTLYTLLSILVAFLLFGLLHGVNSVFNNAVAEAHLDRLYVESRFGLVHELNLADIKKIQGVKGVTHVAHATWFGGSYQDPKQSIFALAVDPSLYFEVYPELNLPADQLDRFRNTRDAAVISRNLADRFHWSVGDRIPLSTSIWRKKTDGSSVWDFEIVGIFDPPEGLRSRTELLFNYAYLDEARTFGTGTVGWIVARIDNPARSTELSADIDDLFANSTDETRTQNEQEKAQSLLKQNGDIGLMVNLIISAVFFTLLLLTGNTMMQSVRERVPEFAVLKTLGYSSATISLIILCEALLICVMAAMAGLLSAWMFFPILKRLTAVQALPGLVLMKGILVAALLATVTAAPAAARIRRLNVVDALAGR